MCPEEEHAGPLGVCLHRGAQVRGPAACRPGAQPHPRVRLARTCARGHRTVSRRLCGRRGEEAAGGQRMGTGRSGQERALRLLLPLPASGAPGVGPRALPGVAPCHSGTSESGPRRPCCAACPLWPVAGPRCAARPGPQRLAARGSAAKACPRPGTGLPLSTGTMLLACDEGPASQCELLVRERLLAHGTRDALGVLGDLTRVSSWAPQSPPRQLVGQARLGDRPRPTPPAAGMVRARGSDSEWDPALHCGAVAGTATDTFR